MDFKMFHGPDLAKQDYMRRLLVRSVTEYCSFCKGGEKSRMGTEVILKKKKRAI
jgi:hypothetical protein